ncbi:MAG: NADH-quinone oxidoreductase subunit L, partial [Actinomycetota bacterium]
SGFFSKDAILASAWHEGEYVLWALGVGTALLTAFYMSRLYLRVFEGRLKVPTGTHPHDAPPLMAAALVPLGVLSLVGGVVNLPGTVTLESFLEPVVGHSEVPHGLTPWVLAGLALSVAVVGIAVARALYLSRSGGLRRRALERRFGPLIVAARNKFYVDEFYGAVVVRPAKGLAVFLAERVDVGVIDGVVNGTGTLVARTAEGLRRLQTGYVRGYAVTFLVGVVVVTSILLLRVS